jgi:V/A-type H+-transporting ATPase subunit K
MEKMLRRKQTGAFYSAGFRRRPGLILGAGLFGGIGIGMSSWFQGAAGAAAADSLTSTGRGFTNYLIILGLIESVALFIMVFLMGILK